ncbi:hypothetical protein OXX80_004727 [Metschnikowia pulcherrima]
MLGGAQEAVKGGLADGVTDTVTRSLSQHSAFHITRLGAIDTEKGSLMASSTNTLQSEQAPPHPSKKTNGVKVSCSSMSLCAPSTAVVTIGLL